MVFNNLPSYLNTITDAKAKMVAINNIINSLFDLSLNFASQSNIQEVYIDNGQSKITTKFRSAKDVIDTITALQQQYSHYEGLAYSRQARLISNKDVNNFGI